MKPGEQEQQEHRTVRRRRVFYIPGYDPIHPRRYRELYRKEAAAQADISGYQIALGPRQGGGTYGWRVGSIIDSQTVQTEFDVLVWSDIVRDSMDSSIPASYVQLVRTAWVYITSGALGRLMQLRKGPVIAALYPVGMLIAQAVLAILLIWACAAVWALGGSAVWGPLPWWGQLPGWGIGVVAGVALMRWFKKMDGKFFAYYLMHDYAYSAQSKGAYSGELEGRIAEFKHAIQAVISGNQVDEVLVVGHSSGAHIGTSVLADLIREGLPAPRPELGFLTLGQVVPMVSFLPNANRLRCDLQFLSACPDLAWIDITAPGDGCAFALCDPVSVSGVAPKDKIWPVVFSAAFTQTLSPARWAELRWRFFRLHFQYLCAFDRPDDYDYFRVTAGPQSLRQRYGKRQPSRSRIERAVSKYTSVGAS